LFSVNDFALRPYLLAETGARQSSCRVKAIGTVESELKVENYTGRYGSKEWIGSEPASTIPTRKPDLELESNAFKINSLNSPECDNESKIPVAVSENFHLDFITTNSRIAENELATEDSKKEQKLDLANQSHELVDLSFSVNTELFDIPPGRDLKGLDNDDCNHKMISLCEECPTVPEGPSVIHSVTKLSGPKKAKISQMYTVAPVLQTPSKSLGQTKIVNTYKRKQHCQRDHPSVRIAQKSHKNSKDICVQERRGNSTSISAQVSSHLHL